MVTFEENEVSLVSFRQLGWIEGTRNDPNSVHKIKTFEILNALCKTDSKIASESGELLKMFAKTYKRNKVLDTPLPKHITDKAQRIASYDAEKKEISQWDSTIKQNRQVIIKFTLELEWEASK